jgi:hypothetical protein
MDFELTNEQKLFSESVRRSALAHLECDALQRAHSPRFPFDVAKLMSDCMRRSRGWMITGGSVEVLKNRIAETPIRSQVRPASAPC